MPHVCLIPPESLAKLDAIKNEPRSKELYRAIPPRKENQPRGRQGRDENGQPRDGQLNTWVRHVGARFKIECPKISSSWLKNNPDIKQEKQRAAWDTVSVKITGL